MMPSRDTFRLCALPLFILLLLFSVHVYMLGRYAINIPFSDDYDEILKNMNLIADSGSLSESARHILHGYGYSKPITLRLVSLMQLTFRHEIDFRYLVITGNMFLLPVCLLFAVSTVSISRYIGIAAACFIFQPQYWEAIYQSTLSNSVFSCLFFSLTSIYCIVQKKKAYTVAALICAVLAQISFGNGFLVYPILLMAAVLQKEYRLSVAVFVLMVTSTWLYMFGSTVSYTAGEHIDLLTKLKLCSVWLLEFLGSSLGYAHSSGYARNMPGRAVSIVIGSLIVAFYLYLVRKKYYDRNLQLFSYFTFFILTAMLAAGLRFNTEVPGASRYQIQSILCILTVLIIVLDLYAAHMNRYAVITLTVVFPMIFTAVSYDANRSVVSGHRTRLISGVISWMTYGKGLTVWSNEDAAGRLLVQCNERNIYRIPSRQLLYSEVWKR